MRVLIKGKDCEVDSCIVDLVLDLQIVGTTGSCCGHFEEPGFITLKDGRRLVILPPGFVFSDWCGVSWRDTFRQFKARAYRLLWRFGFLESFQTTYEVGWPRKLVDVRRG